MRVGRLSILMILLLGWMWPEFRCRRYWPRGRRPPPSCRKSWSSTANSVPYCKASERVILAVKDRYPGQFEVDKFYIDEADALFRRYKVAIVPTQVFLNAAGHEVGRHEGVFTQEALIQKLRELKFIRD